MGKIKSNFNRDSHPEREEDEVFITNASHEIEFLSLDDGPPRSSYTCIGWKTKRIGFTTYDNKGIALGSRWPDSFPVFAKKSEIEKAGKKILEGLLPKK